MRDQVEARADEAVEEQLIDGGFVTPGGDRPGGRGRGDDLRAGAQAAESGGRSLHTRNRRTARRSPSGVSGWVRTAAKEVYKQRSSTIETINGELKTERGLGRLLVRGLRKVQCVALWSALAYNVVHFGPYLLEG